MSLLRFRSPLIIGVFAALALAMTWPLPLHFSDSIPGIQGDVWSYLWAMGWARVSVFDLGTNPFRTDYVFYPVGGATQLLWATSLPSFFSIPLQFAFGLIPAFNLIYLASTVLTGYGTYLLARYILTNIERQSMPGEDGRSKTKALWRVEAGSLVAAVAFAFCALRLGYGLAFTNLYHTELIPFYILFLLRSRSEGGWRNAILAGILLGLNAYIDFQIAAFLVLATALWLLWVVVDGARTRSGHLGNSLRRLAATAVISGIVAAPMVVLVAQDLQAEGGDYVGVYPLSYSSARSYDVLSYFLPNARSSLYADLPSPRVPGINADIKVEGESQLSPDRQAFLGLTVLALALVGAIRRPRALGFWIILVLVFALFSLGPSLQIGGKDTGIPLPFAALHELPFINHIRIPMRYGIMVFFGLSILAGAGAHVLTARIRPLLVTVVAGMLILAETAVFPYPTLPWSVPKIYETIAAQPEDMTILEIPTFNWRAAAAIQAFQVVHQKRVLRVYTNRIAPQVADYFSYRQTPVVVRSLSLLEGAGAGALTDQQRTEDHLTAPAVIAFYRLRYAIVHRDWLTPEEAGQIEEYLRDVLGAEKTVDDGTVAAYEFHLTSPSGQLSVDAQSPVWPMYLGRGWQIDPTADLQGERGVYVLGTSSELFLGQVQCGACAHLIVLRTFSENGVGVLQFESGGQFIDRVSLRKGWAEYRILLPAGSTDRPITLKLLHPAPSDGRIVVSSILASQASGQ